MSWMQRSLQGNLPPGLLESLDPATQQYLAQQYKTAMLQDMFLGLAGQQPTGYKGFQGGVGTILEQQRAQEQARMEAQQREEIHRGAQMMVERGLAPDWVLPHVRGMNQSDLSALAKSWSDYQKLSQGEASFVGDKTMASLPSQEDANFERWRATNPGGSYQKFRQWEEAVKRGQGAVVDGARFGMEGLVYVDPQGKPHPLGTSSVELAKDIQGVANQYQQQSNDNREALEAAQRVQALLNSNDPANDFNVAGALMGWIRVMGGNPRRGPDGNLYDESGLFNEMTRIYNRVMGGSQLTPEQREQVLGTVTRAIEPVKARQQGLDGAFYSQMGRIGAPRDVVEDIRTSVWGNYGAQVSVGPPEIVPPAPTAVAPPAVVAPAVPQATTVAPVAAPGGDAPRAVNPQTGETMIFVNGQWVPAP
jgi:hypothetical protein